MAYGPCLPLGDFRWHTGHAERTFFKLTKKGPQQQQHCTHTHTERKARSTRSGHIVPNATRESASCQGVPTARGQGPSEPSADRAVSNVTTRRGMQTTSAPRFLPHARRQPRRPRHSIIEFLCFLVFGLIRGKRWC